MKDALTKAEKIVICLGPGDLERCAEDGGDFFGLESYSTMHRIPSAIVFQQCVVTPRRWDCSMRCHMLDPLVVVLINASSLVLFPGISRSVSSRFCSLVSCLFQKFVVILVPLGG